MTHFFVRFRNDAQWRQSLAQMEQVVKKVNPNHPFEFQFTRDVYQKTFDDIEKTGRLMSVFGGLAIFISCLGLFGLSAFVAERRKKEMGIRKVLGATMGDVWKALSKDFLQPVLLAFALGAPLAGFAMNALLHNFEYRIGLSWWIFAGAGILVLCIALLTVGLQSVKAAVVNPVQSLRSE